MSGGISLRRLLQSTPLSPGQAVAIGNSLLARLDALHAAGLHHGTIHPDNVRISTDGDVILNDPPADHALLRGYPELAADLRACGLLICATFGVDLTSSSSQPDPRMGPEARAAIRSATAMAHGDSGQSVTAAWSSFVEAAGSLGTRERLVQSHDELGALVQTIPGHGGTLMPALHDALQSVREVGFSGREPLPSPRSSALRQPARAGGEPPLWRRPLFLAAVGGALIVLIVLALTLRGRNHPDVAVTVSSPSQTAAPGGDQTSPTPTATPTSNPDSAVTSVDVQPTKDPCTTGSSCQVRVSVKFPKTTQNVNIGWTIKVTDKCARTSTEHAGHPVTAQPGWTNVYDDATLDLPATKSVTIVATTTAPSQVASSPLTIGEGC